MGYFKKERMNLNVIFRFIMSILRHPVNPVIYMEVVVENCSYIFDTSAIRGGRMQVLHGAKTCQVFLKKATHSDCTH